MGIPYLFASIIKNNRKITRKVEKLKVDFFAVDMNCLIHHYLNPENPIDSVITGIKKVLEIVEASTIYFAFDGLVPLAKIVQQRYRRFKISEESFDKRQISPDTPYMRNLELRIKKEFPHIKSSPTQLEGEGEHKIFLELKELPEEQRKSICIYGLDADLILLSLCHINLGKIQLLREQETDFINVDILELKNNLPIDSKQFIYLSVLCFGNDFMSNLGIFSLREHGYERALEFYRLSGEPDLVNEDGRQQFLEYCANKESELLIKIINKRNLIFEKSVCSSDSLEIIRKYNLHVLDGVLNSEKVVEAFWKTFDWTIQYFFNNIPLNWEWYYSYPDSPLIQDIIQYPESQIGESKLNFKIVDQLQFILPSTTLNLINKRRKFKDEFYSETRDLWLKKYDWEMKPRISLPWKNLTEVKRIS